MRNAKILIGLVAAGLLTAGCGSTGSSSDSSGGGAAQKAMPVAIDGPQEGVRKRGEDNLKVTPAPELSAPFIQKVEHRLRESVLLTAKVAGETSAKCPNSVTQKAGAVSQCVVTYEGAEIPYEVKIGDSYKEGSSIISYNSTAKTGLLVGKVVYDALNERYGSESGTTHASKLACEEIPAAKAVDFNSDTGYKCQYWSKHANNGKGGYDTLRVTTGPTGGIGFEMVK
ncbi:hypothetical protein MTF65_18305 [Streptomyces sp. APSN-46.1]|uniref:hypothetical protein n=1 Tax=Streptomyces sp. APSN-46.1 TaxID=2929049 RepID=UPI001FB4BC1E|nr:hypothetical protein [Streptomyces sp. APSN-46.1]MCJ1679261.1 hypothetical protein [Streptomyces sp. APSN-46.1]